MELLHFLLLTTCKLTQVFFCCCRSAFRTGEAAGVPIADADATPTIILESVAAAMAPTSFSDARPRELNTDRELARPALQTQRRNEDEEQEARITTGTIAEADLPGAFINGHFARVQRRLQVVRNWKLFRSAPASFRMDDRGVPSGPSKGPSLNGVVASNFHTFGLLELTAASGQNFLVSLFLPIGNICSRWPPH